MDDYCFKYVNPELQKIIDQKVLKTVEFLNTDGDGDEDVLIVFTDGSSIRPLAYDKYPDGSYGYGCTFVDAGWQHSKFYPGFRDQDFVGRS